MFNFPLPRTFVLSLLCEDGKISFQNQINQSINQSIYYYVGWGCPDHPSQRLMYKTHDNKNTKSIKIQYI